MSGDDRTALSIAFSLEELVVLADVCDVRLPMLGERPLAGLPAVARDAVLDAAARSLLARGVLLREGDRVATVRAASGLLDIVGASSLRVEVVVDRAVGRLHHTVYAIPYAAVDTSIDADGNHRFGPFATQDLLLHVGRLTGLLADDGREPEADQSVADDAAAATATLAFGAWRAARAAVREGATADAIAGLVEAGMADALASGLVDAMGAAAQTAAVQIVHHPSPTTSAGGEVAWLDAGGRVVWLAPTVDQPFGALAVPGEPAAIASEGREADLDGRPVTVGPTTRAAILRDLLSVLPTNA